MRTRRGCGTRDATSFDFLGYTFGPLHSPRTGGRYNGVQPSREGCRGHQGGHPSTAAARKPGAMGRRRACAEPHRAGLARVLLLRDGDEGAARGAAPSVPRGSPLSAPSAQAGQRLATGGSLCRSSLGNWASCRPWLSRARRCACLDVKPVREPDDRNGHVRFDERGGETE